jgi:hypothetical protein
MAGDRLAAMSNYREQLEAKIISDVRQWLDNNDETYGPTYEIQGSAFLGAVNWTPKGGEVPVDEAFSLAAVSSWFSDTNAWFRLGLLQMALIGLESEYRSADPLGE